MKPAIALILLALSACDADPTPEPDTTESRSLPADVVVMERACVSGAAVHIDLGTEEPVVYQVEYGKPDAGQWLWYPLPPVTEAGTIFEASTYREGTLLNTTCGPTTDRWDVNPSLRIRVTYIPPE
jgi:hypothetical protein